MIKIKQLKKKKKLHNLLCYAILFLFSLTELKLVFIAKFCTEVYVTFQSMEILCMSLMMNLFPSQMLEISLFDSSKTAVGTPEERPFYFAYCNRNCSFTNARFKDYKLKLNTKTNHSFYKS